MDQQFCAGLKYIRVLCSRPRSGVLAQSKQWELEKRYGLARTGRLSLNDY